MNAKEALEIIQGVEELGGTLPEDGLLVEEALDMAIEALKKQVPEKSVMNYGFPEKIRADAGMERRVRAQGPGLRAEKQALHLLDADQVKY